MQGQNAGRRRRRWPQMGPAAALALMVMGATPAARAAAPPTTTANLVPDPQFESGESGFVAQDASSLVVRTAQAPLEGAHSLHVGISGYGNHVWWTYEFTGGLASALRVGAHLRSDVDSSSDLLFCAMAYYANGDAESSCATVSGNVGDKGTIAAELALDPTMPLSTVNIRIDQIGGDPVS